MWSGGENHQFFRKFSKSLRSLQDDNSNQRPTMTRSSGEPIANYRTTLSVGPRGPPLMEDHVFLEDIQHVGRGRIPERKFHAKGVGVHGYFEVTNDITKYCDAKIFSEVGKRTPKHFECRKCRIPKQSTRSKQSLGLCNTLP